MTAMEKFRGTVEKNKTYTIEFDTNIINEEWMVDFRSCFYDFYTLEEHAGHILQLVARYGFGFIEGYGIPLENGKEPYWISEHQKKSVNKGINIIAEEDDCYVNVVSL